jgi:membrane protease YdiL (CAAX protease family)
MKSLDNLKEKIKSHKYIRVNLNEFSKTSNYIIILVSLISIGLNIFFSNYIREFGYFLIIEEKTNYIIQDTLVIYLIKDIIFIVILILIFGKLKPKDIGLEKKKILPAIIVISSIWLFYNIVGLVYTLSLNGGVVFDNEILDDGWNVVLGQFIGQIFGCGPFEEIIYRAFFLIQIYLLLIRRNLEEPNKISKKALISSIIITQIFFALIHIPDRVWENQPLNEYWMDMFSLFIYGVVFVLLYLRTNNILIVAGIHALLNRTTSLFMPSFYSWIIIWIFAVLLLIFYPIIIDKMKNKKHTQQNLEEEEDKS